jgi:hypothetical protein
MAHGSIPGCSVFGVGFDVSPESDVDIKPSMKYEKKSSSGENTTKVTKQVPEITGLVLQFKDFASMQGIYDLLSPEDGEITISFIDGTTAYINGTFDIVSSSSLEGTVGITIFPSVPVTVG